MRIVVETALNRGEAEYANVGDVAMLQVAVRRLRELWPEARIDVLTESATQLGEYCPGADALPRLGRDLWVGTNEIVGAFGKVLPAKVFAGCGKAFRSLRRRFPKAWWFLWSVRLGIRDRRQAKGFIRAFLSAVNDSDLFVVCGAGGFTDSTKEWDLPMLDTVDEAIRRGIPTAMFGQGMGPLKDVEVLARAREVLPSVDLISLRGARGGPALLESLGVRTSEVLTTGDEAIELAYEARPRKLGEAIGINLRVASYSGVGPDEIEEIRPVLHGFARRHQASLVPVPIAFHAWANDCDSIRKLMNGFDERSDGGKSLDSPSKVINEIGRCRVVVTGAYHAAVFALSQGIPVVGLAASLDYISKFLGLEDQFGSACQTVVLGKPETAQQLRTALEQAWVSADDLRAPLQAAAQRQIALSRRAYERIKGLVNSKQAGGRQVVSLGPLARRALEQAKAFK